ncbi:MAG: phage minor head protein, partial [Usitatibacteraceae bacterium]
MRAGVPHRQHRVFGIAQIAAPDFGGDLFIGYENPVPEDREFTLKVLQAGVGVASVDEWRDLAGLGRIHGGSVFIANSSGYSAYQNPSMIQPIQTTSPVTPSATAKTPTPTVPTAAPAQQKSKSATKPNPSTKAPPQSRGAQLQVENRVIGGAVLMAMLEAAIQTDLMFELCSPIFLEILVEFGVLRAKELGKDISIDDAAMQLIMQQERARFDEYITATTRNQIAEILEPVLSKSIDEQRTAIIDYFSSSTVSDRAKMIADTETVVTSEKAALRAYNAAGIVKRRWLSTPDGRTRDSHRAMNGQETNLLGDFVINRGKNSGRTGKGPGLFGIASEDIYCRCVSTIVVDRERDADLKYSIFRDEINNPQITRAVWERVEAKRVQFQDQLLVAIQAGFDAQ